MKTLLILSLLLAACTVTAVEPDFIDYTILRPNPDVPGEELWVSPDTKWYDRVIVEPFVAQVTSERAAATLRLDPRLLSDSSSS